MSSPKDSKWFVLKERVRSLVFVATPHRGSEWANRLHTLFIGPGTAFLQLLKKKESALLATVAEQFNNRWGQRPILCFREGRGIGILGKVRCQTKNRVLITQTSKYRLSSRKMREQIVKESKSSMSRTITDGSQRWSRKRSFSLLNSCDISRQ